MLFFGRSGEARGSSLSDDGNYELWLNPAQNSETARAARRGIQTLVLCALFCVVIIGLGALVEHKFTELKRVYEENDRAWFDVFQKLEVLLDVEQKAVNTADVALRLQQGIAADYKTIKAREAALAEAHQGFIYQTVAPWFDTHALPLETDPRAHRLVRDLIAMPAPLLLITLDAFTVELAGGSLRNANEIRLRAALDNIETISKRLSEIILFFLVGTSFAIIALSIHLWQRQIAPRIAELDTALRVAAETEASLTAALHKLRQANMEQSDFTYSLSHDLKTPTNTIRMLLAELREELDGALGQGGNRVLTDLETTVERMTRLIEDVVIYSQSVGEDMPVGPVDLNIVMEEILQDSAGDITATGADIRRDPLPQIEGNRIQLKMLLSSLISNAIKFRHPERTPLVEIRLSESPSPDWVGFSVTDNGIGIPEKHQQHIFGLFKRLHTYNIYKGSGIGLAICQRVVSNHGGQIRVNSIAGMGTVFTVLLPSLRRAPPQEAEINPDPG